MFIASWFGINLVLGTTIGASIPKFFAYFDDASKGTNLSITAGVGGIVVTLITPLFGRLSDRSMSRLGKRRPWILGGAVAGLLGVGLLAGAGSLGQVVLGWAIVQTGFGAANAAVHALLADQIPKRIRARVAAAAGASGGLALILGAQLVALLPEDAQWTWFVVPGVIGAGLNLGLFVVLRDIVRTERPSPWRMCCPPTGWIRGDTPTSSGPGPAGCSSPCRSSQSRPTCCSSSSTTSEFPGSRPVRCRRTP